MTTFSVITIVRNDPVGVVRTLQSVFSQTFPDYEIIVQDGASTDATSDLLRRMEGQIDSLTIEPDKGIYDAMNRALMRATGDWLIFMNAADFFVDDHVLGKTAEILDLKKDDIVSGYAIRDEDGQPHSYWPADQFWAGSTRDHQATFIRRELMQSLRYRMEFPVAADLDFFTRARNQGAQFRHIDLPIARKPFSYGASAAFINRLDDRLKVLEPAYGEKYPVRDLLRRELINKLSSTYKVHQSHLEHMPLEELRATWALWDERLQ